MSASMPLPRDAVAALLGRYQVPAGVADELMDAAGTVRPVWRRFMEHIAGQTPEQLRHQIARANHYLRDAGVYYRQYDAGVSAELEWPLSHVPVLIDEADWNRITAGLIQRANLLEAVARDIYGPNILAREGHIPASLIASSPEWLRPLVGSRPRGGHFLNFAAFEIGRGPDGEWWVLGDRTQAPSGVGFALQNRVATARAFAEFYANANVHRLAGFFRHFRDSLNGMRNMETNRVSILTPGPMNETYFEHAYIARYLGFGLLEGDDLMVEDGELMVRTVTGPAPIDVLWRRIDSNFTDPLELDATSQIGTPGLVSAVRNGNVTLVNALGTGILEIRALLAFLPKLCQHLLGEPLALPNIATWWCGQPAEAGHVRSNADRMIIGEALSTRLPFELDDHAFIHGNQADDTLGKLEDLLRDDPASLVGQEVVTLSTTPALVDGVLLPRPMSLRVFLARTRDGWRVMPGGYARIGRSENPAAIAMRRGGSAADVWIVSPDPVAQETMLAPPEGPFSRAVPGTLPSRAADNLYWLGRYVERTEGHLRLLRALHLRLSEDPSGSAPTVALLRKALDERGLGEEANVPDRLLQTIASAVNSASKIRDRFSVDGWMALNDLAKTAKRFSGRLTAGDDAARAMGVLLRKVSGFTGLVHENMYRFVGWRFMSIGRALERTQFILQTLRETTASDAPEGALDLAVEIADSAMTLRRRYALASTRATVVDLLALDPMNPRSILFSANEIKEHVAFLPGADVFGQLSALSRAVLQMQTSVAVLTPTTLDGAALQAIRQQAFDLSDLISTTYFR
ncbi:MAG: circularly permuted type 2 ATP-grasp protein [Methylocystis sp.]|nr:circularly permuted type 2 ATP-grasp protein [Methylocystis sp.]MCA3582196.1 circularly permuted type 2 ATP-grasp protein [Methylocystis sp.]MCA3587912.1 circularly permuted type 2 ATP-grasp protein [Methylocystis sp.]MCA3590257.1 circularly permuted type 2 ATP-grasp protein [Methylocystis sp.]